MQDAGSGSAHPPHLTQRRKDAKPAHPHISSQFLVLSFKFPPTPPHLNFEFSEPLAKVLVSTAFEIVSNIKLLIQRVL